MRCLLALFVAFLMLAPGARAAPDPRTARTDALLASLARADEPGLVVGVWQDGRAVYRGARGLADLEQGTPLDPSSVFHLASLSKASTGAAVLKLVAAGRIDLDADVHRYLPELPDFGATVRVSHLLHMTSGIKDQWFLTRLAGRDWQDVISQDMLLSAVRRLPSLDFQPGAEYVYSNSNYLLLAEIVARVTGRPFRDVLATELFAPLGLRSTFVYEDANQPVPHRANSYYHLPDKGWRRQLLAYENWGATSVHSTLDDMLRWGIALERERLGGQPLFRALAQPTTLAGGAPNLYGAGLYRSGALGLETFEHGAGDASFRHHLRYFPGERLGVVVLTNSEAEPSRIADLVARLWLTSVPSDPARPYAGPAPAGIAGLYAGGRSDGAVRIRKEAGSLVMEVAGEPGAKLTAIGPDRLAATAVGISLVVQRDAAGRVTGLLERNAANPAAPFTIRRRRLASPADPRLADYVGTYRNAALAATLDVTRGKDGLTIAPVLSPLSFDMEPADPDRFEMWDYAFRTAKFVRRDGRVVALDISGDRARNIRFDRLDDAPAPRRGSADPGQ